MSISFDAIYDGGVFRPIGPIALPEQTRVKVTATMPAANPDSAELAEKVAKQRAAIERSIKLSKQYFADHPEKLQQPVDGWSARDHDRVLYDEQQ